MALHREIRDDTHAIFSYWRIEEVITTFLPVDPTGEARHGRVLLRGYVNEQARRNGARACAIEYTLGLDMTDYAGFNDATLVTMRQVTDLQREAIYRVLMRWLESDAGCDHPLAGATLA